MDIRILIADDHAVVRDGIKAVLGRDGKNVTIVGEASDGSEVLSLAEKEPVDVFILDISMPGMSGIDTAVRLLKMNPQTKIIILSMYKDKVVVERAIKSGARGYLLKESATDEILKAVYEVYAGKYFLSPGIAGYLVEGYLNKSIPSEEGDIDMMLSPRQREILKFICDGFTEKDIAQQLNISLHTVHVHKNNIMKRLDIHTKAGLIKHAIKNGIIQI